MTCEDGFRENLQKRSLGRIWKGGFRAGSAEGFREDPQFSKTRTRGGAKAQGFSATRENYSIVHFFLKECTFAPRHFRFLNAKGTE